jgi:hypothetical protein
VWAGDGRPECLFPGTVVLVETQARYNLAIALTIALAIALTLALTLALTIALTLTSCC